MSKMSYDILASTITRDYNIILQNLTTAIM